MNQRFLYIIPIEPFPDAALIGPLGRFLSAAFGDEIRVQHVLLDLRAAFNAERNQFNSSSILIELLRSGPPDAVRMLGVSDFDLFVPILTFLFGEAQFGGKAAVVSTRRLRDEFYGLNPNPQLLQERLMKESVHELGHVYGLLHCPVQRCVMNVSANVDEIDAKSVLFCRSCREELRCRRSAQP